jgi:hypothetical protein
VTGEQNHSGRRLGLLGRSLMHLIKRGFDIRGKQAEVAEQQNVPPRRVHMERCGSHKSVAISAADLKWPVQCKKQ